MAPPRFILLRRPPTIRVVDEPFVPGGIDLGEAERRWRELVAANPAFHDGRLLHVLGIHRNGHGGATVHAAECAYRWFAVGLTGLDAGVRPLGVKGITCAQGHLLLGRRARCVAAYAGAWEFAPGGGVEPGRSPASQVLAELEEETGLAAGPAVGVVARAIAFDPAVRSWEIVHAIDLPARAPLPRRTAEYEELRWVPVPAPAEAARALPRPLTPIATAMLRLLPVVESPRGR